MRGYKAFNADLTCNGYQYAIGETYEMADCELCDHGFHFCRNIADCFSYYDDVNDRFAEVEALGEVMESDEDSKCVTNKIRIIKEIPRAVAVEMSNSGNENSGDRNSGNWNSGDRNSGNGNSGNWNTCNNSAGCFNTEVQTITMFNKPTNWTLDDYWNSEANRILSRMPVTYIEQIWTCPNDMSDAEKSEHPEHETTGGFLKAIEHEADPQAWWDGLSEKEKGIVMSLPNFDAEIFKECTGINVRGEEDETD